MPTVSNVTVAPCSESDVLSVNASSVSALRQMMSPPVATNAGAPAGALIDPVTGVFTWTPTEAQGPGSYSFDVVVTDDGTHNLNDFETITVTVGEVNRSPVLDPVGDQSGDEQALLSFTATGSDPA